MEMEDEGDMPVWGRNAKRLRTGYNAPYGDEEEEELENEDEDEDNDEDEGQREMQVYDIRGVPVGFPFNAYDSQRVYMEKVIQSLQEVRPSRQATTTHRGLCLTARTEQERAAGEPHRYWQDAVSSVCLSCLAAAVAPLPVQLSTIRSRLRRWCVAVRGWACGHVSLRCHLRYDSTKPGRLVCRVA